MSKTYKGYELMKAIAEGEIEDGTKFKDLTNNNYADNSNIYRYENKNFIGRWGETNILKLLKHDFELIEDEIDIQSIEKLSESSDATYGQDARSVAIENRFLINEILEAVKQLDIKSK